MTPFMETEALTIQIRRATLADAESIATLLHDAFREYRSSYTKRAFEATTPKAHRIVARLGEGPVAGTRWPHRRRHRVCHAAQRRAVHQEHGRLALCARQIDRQSAPGPGRTIRAPLLEHHTLPDPRHPPVRTLGVSHEKPVALTHFSALPFPAWRNTWTTGGALSLASY